MVRDLLLMLDQGDCGLLRPVPLPVDNGPANLARFGMPPVTARGHHRAPVHGHGAMSPSKPKPGAGPGPATGSSTAGRGAKAFDDQMRPRPGRTAGPLAADGQIAVAGQGRTAADTGSASTAHRGGAATPRPYLGPGALLNPRSARATSPARAFFALSGLIQDQIQIVSSTDRA